MVLLDAISDSAPRLLGVVASAVLVVLPENEQINNVGGRQRGL